MVQSQYQYQRICVITGNQAAIKAVRSLKVPFEHNRVMDAETPYHPDNFHFSSAGLLEKERSNCKIVGTEPTSVIAYRSTKNF